MTLDIANVERELYPGDACLRRPLSADRAAVVNSWESLYCFFVFTQSRSGDFREIPLS